MLDDIPKDVGSNPTSVDPLPVYRERSWNEWTLEQHMEWKRFIEHYSHE